MILPDCLASLERMHGSNVGELYCSEAADWETHDVRAE